MASGTRSLMETVPNLQQHLPVPSTHRTPLTTACTSQRFNFHPYGRSGLIRLQGRFASLPSILSSKSILSASKSTTLSVNGVKRSLRGRLHMSAEFPPQGLLAPSNRAHEFGLRRATSEAPRPVSWYQRQARRRNSVHER